MIPETTLRDVQGHIMDAMTALYTDAKDDADAQFMAFTLVQIWEDIEFQILTREVV